MKRTLDRRALAVLLASTVVFAAVAYGAHAVQVSRSSGVFLQTAEHAARQDDGGRAAQYYRAYLRFKPDAAATHARLGQLLADRGNAEGAVNSLEQALRLNPSDAKARLILIRAAMQIGRYQDALDHLGRLLAEDEDAELLDLAGQCYQAKNDFASAADPYRRAIALDGRRVDAYVRLARLLRENLDRPREADDCLTDLVTRNPDVTAAHVARGAFLKSFGDYNEASLAAERALDVAPDDAAALSLAADCELLRNQPDGARRYAERGLERYPNMAGWYLQLAAVESAAGNRNAAIDVLRRGVSQATGQHEDLLGNLANLLLDEGRVAEVHDPLKMLRQLGTSQPLASYLEGRVSYAEGAWLEASRTLERCRSEVLDAPDLLKQVDFWLGECYGQLGSADQQLIAYRRAVDADPLWTRPRFQIVTSLAAIGRTSQALRELEDLMKLDDAPLVGWLEMARLTVLRNLSSEPGDVDWTVTETLLREVEKRLPDSPLIPILRAEILVNRKDADEAERQLEAALALRPEQTELWTAAIELAQRRRDWPRTLALIERAQTQLGDAVELRLAQASYIVRQDAQDKTSRLHALTQPPESYSDAQIAQLWSGLAGAALQTKDFALARDLLRRLAERQPHNLRLWLLCFDVALAQQDAADIESVLAKIREIEGAGPLWRYGCAVQLFLTDADDAATRQQALAHLAEARKLRPAWSRVPMLIARLRLKQNETDAAIGNLVDAIQMGERDAAVVRETVQLLYQRQRYREADALIRQVEERRSPFSSELGRLASQVSIQLQNFDRALSVARRNAAESQHVADHIWLGQVASLVGADARSLLGEGATIDSLHAEAERAFRRAVELSADAPDAWVALIQFLARSGNLTAAQQMIREAEQKIEPSKAPLALAQCYEEIRQTTQAERSFRDALAAAPDEPATQRLVSDFFLRTGKPQVAEETLLRLKANAAASIADIAWARRQLALLALVRGGLPNLDAARELVSQNLADAPTSASDLRARALVLAAYGTSEGRQEALSIWRQVLRDDPFISPEDRLTIASLYEAEGNWTEAGGQLRSLLAATQRGPSYVSYLATYVAALLRHGELTEAGVWLAKLAQRDQQGWLTAALQAEVDARQRRHERAILTITTWLATSGKDGAGSQIGSPTAPPTLQAAAHLGNLPDWSTITRLARAIWTPPSGSWRSSSQHSRTPV